MKTINKTLIGLCLILTIVFVTSGTAAALPYANYTFSQAHGFSQAHSFQEFVGLNNFGTQTLIPLNPVQFTDLSTGNIISWNWNFGDGTGNSTQRNPIHTFGSAQYYTVRLTVTDNNNLQDYCEKQIFAGTIYE